MPASLPVVIIPGYYGTILIDRGAGNKEVWLTLGGIFNSGQVLDAINLETGDPDRIVSAGILEEVTIIGNWAPNVYKGLRLFLGSIGLPPEEVISFGVDWRQTLAFNVDQLRDKIKRIGKVNIIAHSHGGLIAREYLRKHGGELVDNFITLGTPHKGMLKTLQALVEGVDIFKWSKSHVMKTARTFPSAYELLPSDAEDGLFLWNGKKADPFTTNPWADAAIKTKLAQGAGVIMNLPRQLPVKTAIIYGTHLDTNAIAEGGSNKKKLKFRELPIGDGTVPAISASGRGLTSEKAIERYAIPYGIHSQLFEHQAAQRIMKNILFDRPMAHFACAFERNMYRRGETLGLGVDVRGPRGEVLPDAAVRLTIGGREFPVPRDEDAGDYFVNVKMPQSSQHLPYKVTATSSAFSQPLTFVDELHALNA
jgi:hypothetical protein